MRTRTLLEATVIFLAILACDWYFSTEHLSREELDRQLAQARVTGARAALSAIPEKQCQWRDLFATTPRKQS